LAKHSLTIKQHSPNALFGAGVVGMIGSTVLACRSTLKLEDHLNKTSEDLELARQIREDKPEEYSEKDFKRDSTIIYVRGVVSVGKLYAPAVALGVVSVGLLTKSHTMLNDRVAAVTAAYTALDKGFEAYRARVIEKYGEDAEREIRFPREKIKEQNPETGRDHTVEVISDDSPSIYAKFFDQMSPSWSKDPEYNIVFLHAQQTYWNNMLHARGHVFLNEVYRELGLPHTKAGSVVGWVLKGDGDSYVDFGIFDPHDESTRSFVNGREGAILLDFNVDGVIYDKIENHEEIKWQS
jgi:hypothetical protein